MKCSCGFEGEPSNWDKVDVQYADVRDTYVGYQSAQRSCKTVCNKYFRMKVESVLISCPECGAVRIIDKSLV